MASKWTAERIAKVLSDISKRAPPMFLQNVVTEQEFTPNLKKLVDVAIDDTDLSEAKKEGLRVLKATGMFDKKVPIENPKVAREFDKWYEREIQKEIKKGNLPPRKLIPTLPHVKDIIKKVEELNKGSTSK